MKKLASALALTVVAACSGTDTSVVHPGTPAVDHPDWVMKGSGFIDKGSKIMYGVGSASGIRNISLLRMTADNRARAEISKLFEVYSASLMKDYAASTTAGDFTASSEEQHVGSAIKTFSAMTLNGVVVTDHWIHPVDGTMYTLVKLDIDGFHDQLDKSKELSAKVKERVKRAAAKAFADLDREEAKHAEAE